MYLSRGMFHRLELDLHCHLRSRKRPCRRRSAPGPANGRPRNAVRAVNLPGPVYDLSIYQSLTRRLNDLTAQLGFARRMGLRRSRFSWKVLWSPRRSQSASSRWPVLPSSARTPHPPRSRDEKPARLPAAAISFRRFEPGSRPMSLAETT